MKQFSGYMHGVNLGGWLSQCNYKKEHLDSFIVEDDINQFFNDKKANIFDLILGDEEGDHDIFLTVQIYRKCSTSFGQSLQNVIQNTKICSALSF